jgi:UDP-N-acetylmuramoyl-L-alanyl-D-glutamate--2,6-diaminopimelate ligase
MNTLRSIYHYLLALLGALIYRFPARHIYVVAITGTKGKTSTVELVNAILETAGFRTAICSTLRFKVGEDTAPNRLKMTMPGRFFIQRFLRAAVEADCHYAIVEMTSEGAKQSRHRFVDLDALIFTNLSPEHLESHGSYENYLAAKLEIAKQLERSRKPNKLIVVNSDDRVSGKFLNTTVPRKVRFHYGQAEPVSFTEQGTELTLGGEKVTSLLPGRFNIYNILGAVAFARAEAVGWPTIRRAVEHLHGIRGRMEEVGRQEFKVIVDYAHTPDSLKQVYQTLGARRKICVLGGTGGGRDTWKRPVMG